MTDYAPEVLGYIVRLGGSPEMIDAADAKLAALLAVHATPPKEPHDADPQ